MKPTDIVDSRIAAAELEIRRFMMAVKAWRASGCEIYNSRQNATVKRASMDLSNALVAVRKSPYRD